MQRFGEDRGFSHLCRGSTIEVQTKNSTDLEPVPGTELKSVEFFVCTKRVTEIFDVHTDFTAGEMLHLYRSMTRTRMACCTSIWDKLLGKRSKMDVTLWGGELREKVGVDTHVFM